MNPYTPFKFNFTFEVWLDIPSPDGSTSLETFYENGTCILVPGISQTYMYTKKQIPFNSVIKNMKDPVGKAVFEEFGQDVRRYVNTSEPVFDYLGNVNGYRHSLRRNPFTSKATD